jgi:hypothetical protein
MKSALTKAKGWTTPWFAGSVGWQITGHMNQAWSMQPAANA